MLGCSQQNLKTVFQLEAHVIVFIFVRKISSRGARRETLYDGYMRRIGEGI